MKRFKQNILTGCATDNFLQNNTIYYNERMHGIVLLNDQKQSISNKQNCFRKIFGFFLISIAYILFAKINTLINLGGSIV